MAQVSDWTVFRLPKCQWSGTEGSTSQLEMLGHGWDCFELTASGQVLGKLLSWPHWTTDDLGHFRAFNGFQAFLKQYFPNWFLICNNFQLMNTTKRIILIWAIIKISVLLSYAEIHLVSIMLLTERRKKERKWRKGGQMKNIKIYSSVECHRPWSLHSLVYRQQKLCNLPSGLKSFHTLAS